MHNPYRGGTPDVWYSGKGGDLWIEYKWGKGKLSPLQFEWLTKRHEEGRNVAVCKGSAKGAVVLDEPGAFQLTDAEVADWILMECG